jgi:hypothetical protein
MSHLFSSLPIWIYVLFFGLIYLGYAQTRTRKVSRFRITVLPTIMVALSFYTVVHVPNSTGLAVATWITGIGAAFWLNSVIPHGKGVILHPDSSHYVVPGSSIPLFLMMSVFVAKFTLGYLSGSHIVNAEGTGFILASSALAGLISGTFVARAVQIFNTGNASLRTLTTQGA